MILKDGEITLKKKLDDALSQSRYFEKKALNLQEACEWLQKKLTDAE